MSVLASQSKYTQNRSPNLVLKFRFIRKIQSTFQKSCFSLGQRKKKQAQRRAATETAARKLIDPLLHSFRFETYGVM